MLVKMTNFEFKLHLLLQNKALESCLCCITNPLCYHFNLLAAFAQPGGTEVVQHRVRQNCTSYYRI